MATNYQALGSYPDVEFLGGTATRLVQVFRIKTIPHGVYVEWRLPKSLLATANVDQARSDVAAAYENLFGHPGIADVAWAQGVTPSQQLQDHLILFVSSSSGLSSDTLDFVSQPWTPDVWLAAAAAEQARLDASEA
jgi:hypothetical protein